MGTIALALVLLMGNAVLVSAQPEIVGDWRGALETPVGSLPLVFRITQPEDGLAGTLDSPNQGAIGIPVDRVVFEAGHLTLGISAIGGTYEGDLTPEGTINGRWSQGGASLELTLERTKEVVSVPCRPQEPEAPFPYDVEDVGIPSSAPGVTLAGTLTLPSDVTAPVPAVVLISGSGPQDRDETILGHRPFLVLADHLTRLGVAVLRLDDRGVGASTGSFAAATTEDFADDVLAAVEFLDGRRDVRAVGLIGHSEGGLVAPMVADRSSAVDFVVLMAGPGLTGEEILYRQSDLIIKANGGSDALAEANRQAQAALFAILKTETDVEVVRAKLRDVLMQSMAPVAPADAATGATAEDGEVQIERQLAQLTQPWFRFFLTYDPVPALHRLTVPVLAINGEKDTQVPARENLAAIRHALAEGGNADVEVVELPGLNHLFQTAMTGSPIEYALIEETISPRALRIISDWVLARFPTR